MDLKKYINKKTVFLTTCLFSGMVLSVFAANYGTGYFALSTAAIMAGAIAIDRKVIQEKGNDWFGDGIGGNAK